MKNALSGIFEAYGQHLTAKWKAPGFTASRTGARVKLDVDGALVVGDLSAWKQLAGRYWAHALPPPQAEALGAHLQRLMRFEGSVWSPFADLLDDERVVTGVAELARLLEGEGHTAEAFYCKHSIIFCEYYGEDVLGDGPAHRAKDAAFTEKGALSMLALVKIAIPFLDTDDPLLRLEALRELRRAFDESPGKLLSAHRLVRKHVIPLCDDPAPLVREAAISIVARWSESLFARNAYVEAEELFDLLIPYGMRVPQALAHRIGCRYLRGADAEAEADRERLRRLVGVDIVWHGLGPIDILGVEARGLIEIGRAFAAIEQGNDLLGEKRRKSERSLPAWSTADCRRRRHAMGTMAVELLKSPERAEFMRRHKKDAASQSDAFFFDRATALLD